MIADQSGILKAVLNIMLLGFACIVNARAATLLDLSSDQFLRQAEVLRAQLNLSSVQSVPWLQAEAKSREILREQKARHERFQIELTDKITAGHFSISNALEGAGSEDEATRNDRRMLMDLWSGVFARLDDVQVRQVGQFLSVLMAAPSPVAPEEKPKDLTTGEQPRQRGSRGNRGGASMGIGGGFGGNMSKF
jgi:hypothetical protein